VVELIDSPEITSLARKYGVYAPIHPQDFIFCHHQNNPPRSITETAGMYYSVGNDSATRLIALLDKTMPGRQLSVFEFAAGYGCVSRHLRLHDRLYLVPCDIHEEAVAFMRNGMDLPAIGSVVNPEDFDSGRRFDVVFVLSFFTHMPEETWTAWFNRLFRLVEEGGVFIFTTHGFKPWRDVGSPETGEKGFWFAPTSEQKDLPGENYGCTVSLPHYVFNAIRAIPEAELEFYQPDMWGGHQDTFVVRRHPKKPDLAALRIRELEIALRRSQLHSDALQRQVLGLRASTSWRVTSPLRAIRRWLAPPAD
jgi:hypothetical protein